ncbi:uncharacterized protein LOC122505677 isoform X1 [Leptopilina heterotoma]|uniref:uncharacterized protein LOC122505677 isoform X1 n=1 Tax=Leptopilina heterotoma TaxID=63436 RepID=UPI001CA8A224|nr:uncharacterized protein LOC122505677 isoform X1 [Leptopilina heterotoma]
MVRHWKRKNPPINKEDLEKAIKEVSKGKTIKETAKEFGLCYGTLRFHCINIPTCVSKRPRVLSPVLQEALSEIKEGMSINKASKNFELNYETLRIAAKKENVEINKFRQVSMNVLLLFILATTDSLFYFQMTFFLKVFTNEQENALMVHLLKSSEIFYGLTTGNVRSLAYDLAKKLNIFMPESWKINKMAGKDWLQSFMKRHPNLSLRKPQSTSLARASAFNQHNVDSFFLNLNKVMDEVRFDPGNIWNMDETGLSTVHQPGRVVAQRGAKQVSKMTSGERGTSITIAVAVSATGNKTPPFFIFPRVRNKPEFLRNAPNGSRSAANGSGWMTKSTFLDFLNHFQKTAHSSPQNPTLLLFDNHESHISSEAMQFCIDNGIHVVSFPPHCTHKMQPLDRSVFGPFKKAITVACDDWMRRYVTNITIHNLAEIIKEPFIRAFTHSNIEEGFRCTGIYPPNSNIFFDSDFAPSSVTDRPLINVTDIAAECDIEDDLQEREIDGANLIELDSLNLDETIQNIMPFPKAPARKETARGRRRGRTQILTSPEVMGEIRRKEAEIIAKKREIGRGRPRGRPRGSGRNINSTAGCNSNISPEIVEVILNEEVEITAQNRGTGRGRPSGRPCGRPRGSGRNINSTAGCNSNINPEIVEVILNEEVEITAQNRGTGRGRPSGRPRGRPRGSMRNISPIAGPSSNISCEIGRGRPRGRPRGSGRSKKIPSSSESDLDLSMEDKCCVCNKSISLGLSYQTCVSCLEKAHVTCSRIELNWACVNCVLSDEEMDI